VIVAGRTNAKPNALGIWPGQDPHGRYTKLCIAFADEYGWVRGEVCTYWSQIALAREFEGGRPRDVAEDGAWRDIQLALRDLKTGAPD
jgi:hypothetical protein